MVHARASFGPTNDAPGRSRRFVREALAQWDAIDLVPVAQLVVSELVTNAVFHAVTPIDVHLSWTGETLRIEIHDGTSAVPAITDAATERGGFGLRIVEQLVHDWGIIERHDGKAIWLTIERADAP